jgi:hypothetical protein
MASDWQWVMIPYGGSIHLFEWMDEFEDPFLQLKEALTNAPILRALNWTKLFHVHVDASNFAIGCILAQPGEHKMDFIVSYASRKLNDAKKNYNYHQEERPRNDLCGE